MKGTGPVVCVLASSVLVDLRSHSLEVELPAWDCVMASPDSSLPALPAPPPVEEVDNTVTLIILAVVGGVIGLLVSILLLKKLITFILKKTREKK